MVKFTKLAIMLGFIALLKVKSLDKVTVKDICEFCEINRNTFYYYYEGIYDVLDCLFKTEAVKNIYNSKHVNILENYLETVVKDFVLRSVQKEASKYSISDQDINYITCFYSYAIIGNTMRWIANGMPPT